MYILKTFWRKSCSRCPQAIRLVDQLKTEGIKVEGYDLASAEGLAEGAFYSVKATPTLLIIDDNDKEVAEWRGEIPHIDDVRIFFL